MISITGLTVVFNRTIALHEVSLELGPGVVGLFGPNAAGKSTLLRTVAGFIRATSGAVAIDGHPAGLGDEERRRHIGWVGHDSGLYTRLSVRENLELFATLYDVDNARVQEVIASLGLTERASSPVQALSAGLVRRASAARALLHDPTVLLLDEPYANLDDDACELLSAAVREWRERPGPRVAIIATHGAKRVKSFADESVILQHGAVVSHRKRRPDIRRLDI